MTDLNLFNIPFDGSQETREPEFINEEGTKWWACEHLTEYATRKGLVDIKAWYIKTISNEKNIVLVDNIKNTIVYTNTSIEAVAVFIDVLKIVAGSDE